MVETSSASSAYEPAIRARGIFDLDQARFDP
jgi:hypothetical protein